MSDLIGKTLGQYRILEQIGVGGMATVYRAYQPSMDRDVAIKVLPHYLSEDRQFAERFQREAHAIARLEHAHILPVYDYGECDGVTYIAMRYIHAGTLKELMSKGRLSLNEINRLIGQVGSALDYAHSQGVVHRDIKPSNVLIDPQGNTYLTDFGLARMLEASQQLTASGVGIGTPAYMSPEQGQGIKVDHRSDIYSLGVMLYEMVTGRVPYEAETPMAVVLKHITEALPLPRDVAPNVPEVIEKVILRAMAKDPAHRFQSACDLVQALNQAVRKASPPEPAQATVVAEAMPTREHISLATRVQRMQAKPRNSALLVVGAAVVLAVFGLLFSQLLPVAPGPATSTARQVTAATAAQTPLFATAAALPATPIAPVVSAATGECRIAYVGENNDIYVKNCDGSNVRRVTEGRKSTGHEPAWSPDGQRLVFDDEERGILIVNADGSGLTPIISPDGLVKGAFPAWSPDGSRIAYMGCKIMTMHPDGSNQFMVVDPLKLMHVGDPNWCADRPHWSPDSRRIGFSAFNPDTFEIRFAVVNADGTGLIELASFQLKGRPPESDAYLLWSPDGNRVAFLTREGSEHRYYLMNADGSGEPVQVESIPDSWHAWYWPQWGQDLAASTAPCRTVGVDQNQEYDLFTQDCDGSNKRRLTVNRGFGSNSPSWSPDGQRIVFDGLFGEAVGQGDIYLINADGSNQTLFLEGGEGGFGNPAWSPDGERIAYMDGCNIKTIRLDGSDMTTVVNSTDLMNHPGDPEMCVYEAAWSPDSKRLAVWAWQFGESLPGPREERVAVVNADGTDLIDVAAFQIKEGNVTPYWSPDGSQVAYLVWEDSTARYFIVNADGSNQPIEIDSIPDSWSQSHWPQWDGRAPMTRTFINPKDFQTAISGLGAPTVVDFENTDAKPVNNTFKDRKPFDGATYAKEGIGFSSPNKTPLYIAPGGLFWNASNSLSVGQFPNDTNARAENTDDDLTIRLDPPAIAVGFTLIDLSKREATHVTWLDASGAVVAEIPLPNNYENEKYRAFVGIVSPNRPIATIRVDEGLPRDGDDVNYDDFIFIPASTSASQADQARTFAEPILQAIADRAPDHEDDFSDPGSGWPSGSTPSGDKWGYEDDAYFISATRRSGDACCGAAPASALALSDFVLEVDAQIISGERGNWYVLVRGSDDAHHYGVGLSVDGDLRIWKNGHEVYTESHGTLGETRITNFEMGDGTNHLTIIAQGPQIAVYVNGAPAWLIYDESLSRGWVALGVGNEAEPAPLRVRFDNLRIWDISNLPLSALTPHAE